MNDRVIGKVISVDSFRVVVQMNDDLKGLYKSGFNDIYEIARINSYIIIPVGADRIVAIITRVKVQDETEIEKFSGSISLPKSSRYLVATMIGTIADNSNYIQGVYNYPILDNPVWYVVKEDLNLIFDSKEKEEIDFDKDYYLPIGFSPAFNDFKVKVNPDKFFGKHAAVLGNTGSGKSCTVASIIQSLFASKYPLKEEGTVKEKEITNAHFIIFDTNGEYKQAFSSTDECKLKEEKLINPLHIDQSALKVPYWFMNYDDFDYLFEPSSGTQAPILKRAISLAKEVDEQEDNKKFISSFIEKGLIDLLNISPEDLKKKKCKSNYGNWEWYEENEIKKIADAIPEEGSLSEVRRLLIELAKDIPTSEEDKFLETFKCEFNKYILSINETKIGLDKNIDLPTWFSFTKLIIEEIDKAIEEQEGSKGKISEFLSTLRLRLQSYLNDDRIAIPLLLKAKSDFDKSLAIFLSFILGELYKICEFKDQNLYIDYYKLNNSENKKNNQITIIDMSLLAFDVLETITGLIGRLILEFVSRFRSEDRGKFPIVIILEEAQNYIPELNKKDRISIAKRVFERIAREGRKYGISLLISSQRPSELSKTVLSQCNTFIVHRLQNPEDQRYVRQLVSSANEDILQQLPILPQQHAIVMGDAVRSPIQLKLNNASPKPNSDDPEFMKIWLSEPNKDFPYYKKITENWKKGESNTTET